MIGRGLESVLPHTIKRSKPFKYAYEKEIVMYAYFKVRGRSSCRCIGDSAPLTLEGASRNWTIIRPSAFTALQHTVVMPEHW